MTNRNLALAFALLCITACTAEIASKEPPDQVVPSIRESFIALNAELERTVPNPELVGVGGKPGDGTGDTLAVAIDKISKDLEQLPDAPK